MKRRRQQGFGFGSYGLAWLVLAALIAYSPRAFAISRFWLGGSGSWSNPANWSPAGIPANGDDLLFGQGQPGDVTNDLSGLSLQSLSINFSGGGFALWGQDLTVTYLLQSFAGADAINIDHLILGGDVFIHTDDGNGTGGPLTLNCFTVLNGHNLSVSSAGAATVTFQAPINGNGNIAFTAGNNYLASSTGDNIFRGTATVSGGNLWLGSFNGHNLIPSKLVVYGGATALMLYDNMITNTATVEIYSGGNFLLLGHVDTIYSLVLSNFTGDAAVCNVDSGSTGILGINGSIASYNDSGSLIPIIQGRLALNGFTPIATYGSAYAGLDIPAELLGNGFSKAGNSALIVRGTNSFTGGVEVDQGILDVQSNGALGDTSGGTLLYGGGAMTLRASVANEALTIQGSRQITADTSGSLLTALAPTNVTWSGPIELDTNLVVAGSDLTLSGVISGTGGLDIESVGTVLLAGSSGNSFTGTTTAHGPLLELGKPFEMQCFSGSLTVGGAGNATAEVRWLNSDQAILWVDGLGTTLYPNGVLNFNNYTDLLGQVTFNGGLLDSGLTGQAWIIGPVIVNPTNVSAIINGNLGLSSRLVPIVFDVGDGTPDCDLQINATILGPTTALAKQGPGTMCLHGTNTYAAPTYVEAGILEISNASSLGSPAGTVVWGGATLRLNGFPVNMQPQNFEIFGTGVGGTHGAIEIVNASSFVLGNILLDGATTIKADPACVLGLGNISGTGPLTITGGGNVWLEGSGYNSYSSDTVVSQGTLILSKADAVTAVPGNLYVGTADGSTSATARNVGNYQILGNIFVYPGSLWDLNTYQENVDFLGLYGNAGVQAPGVVGYLSLKTGADVYVYPTSASAPATITGTVEMDPGNHHFNIGSGSSSPGLVVSATLAQYSTPAAIEKTGPGILTLNGNNTYQGSTTVSQGTLIAASAGALGAAGTSTTVNSNASLVVDGGPTNGGIIIPSESLILNSSSPAVLISQNGSNTWGGLVTLSQPASINVASNSYLQVLNSVSGPGGLTKTGPGTMLFWGFFGNSYGGVTTVSQGTLEVGRVGSISVPGDIVLGDDTTSNTVAILRTDREQQFSANANIALHNSGLLDVYPLVTPLPNPRVGTVTGGGRINLGTGTSLTISNTVPCTFAGSISGPGQLNAAGSASLRLTGNSSFSGSTLITGLLEVDGSQPFSQVLFGSTGTLQGSGAVGLITMNAGATVAPGVGPGILTCQGFDAGSANQSRTLQIDLNGPNPGTDYDQLDVRGDVNLRTNRLTLSASLNFSSWLSNTFTIIKNDGGNTVKGAFTGLPEGSTLTIGAQQFQISYVGGGGNDVVLTQTTGSPQPPTVSVQPATAGTVVFAWPTNSSGFTLQVNTNLGTTNWTAALPAPVIVGANYVVTNNTVGPSSFYRLVH